MISNPLQNTLSHLDLGIKALIKLCHQIPQTSSIIAGSYFIKSWKGVHDCQNLHIFYNYNTSSFWAVLQGQTDIEFIPSMKDGFEMITVPLLACKVVQDKIMNHQYPFSSAMSSVNFFQKEIRYPLIKKTSNGHTIQLNCAGLLGGGAKVSRNRIGIVEVNKQSKVNKQSEVFFQVKKYLLSRYKILVTNKEDTKDESFVEKLAEKICGVTSFDQASSIEKHLNEFIDLYEEEYIDEIVLDIAGKRMKDGRPQLDDYIKNFSSGGLCMELLRKGYYANERAKGGVSQLISEKILAKLGEETKTLLTKLGQKREGDEDVLHKPVIFEQLFAMLEMRENINSFLKPLSKIKVKKILSFIKDHLKIETEDQQEIITEFCCSDKSEEIFLDITNRLLTLGTRAFSSSPERSPIKSPLKLQVSQSSLLQPIKFESSPFSLPNTPQNLKASHSERNSKVFEESPQSKKTDSKGSSNQIPYLSRLRLNVLNELNLLDHELVTLVELHNMLKLDNTENSEAKGSAHNSKNHKLDDVKSLIMSVVRGYRENESNLDSTELDSLLPVAFIQDPKIFKAFLQVFLEDLANDILFEVKKVRMLSFILISAMRNPDFKEYCQVDDLIQCLKILKPKIEDLSITSENINIQEAMSALNDILFLMGYIGAKGVKGDYLEMVKELTKYMQTHGLEKTFNSLTGKAKDPSLEIKREYAIEAFKRIEGTSFEEWEKNFQNVLQVGNIAINIGKGIFLSDLSSICEALLQIKDLLDKACAHRIQCWYDHVNELRYLAHEPIEKIVKELFGMKQRSYNKKYSFFAAEFLLAVIAQPTRKIREKKMAAQALWFLTNGYDYKMFQSQRYLFKSRTYSFDKDICLFVLQSLLSIAQKTEIDFSIFIRKLVETPFRPEKMENSKIEATAPVKPAEKSNEENPGKRFYVKTLMEKKPRLYALAKIQERSEKALVKPSILVDFRGIDKEKDCEESFVKKLREKVDNLKSTSIEEPIRELMALDAKTASKKMFSEAVNNIVFHKGEFKPEQEKSARNQFKSAVNAKAREINEVNTSELLEVLEEFLVNPTKTVLLIQGDAGAGKTLLLRLFEARLWKKYNMLSKADSKNRNRLPLRIALSEVRSFDKAVDEFLMQHGCDAEAVVDIKKEPAAILFDGYDEINQYINLYNLNKLDTWRDVKVIFTSRKENLTSLKEDYLLCFTPGTDKQKVLSYSIQPVNEDQIRKYFNAQVSENQAQIKKLEDKLKILNGNDSADVTISKTIEREVAWLEKFPTSEHYNCICEISNTLEDHLPEIQDLQEEIEKYKDNGVEVFQLTQVFEKQIIELQKLTDKANIEALAKKLGSDLIEEIKQIEKAVDSCLESLEGEIDADNRLNQVIKARIKRIKGLTDLKRISHIAKKIAQQTEKSADETLTYLKNAPWVENAKSNLKYLGNRTSAQGIKSMCSPEELQKIKDFNKKIKIPSRAGQEIILIDITDAEAYLNKILEHPDLDKFQLKFAKIYEKLDECSTLENELKSLLKGEEQELLQEGKSKTEEESKPEGESKQTEQKKAEGEPKPERNLKPEEKPNLEGEPNPEKESPKELKSEEESKPEEENKSKEKIKPDRDLKAEGESKPEGDLELEDKSHSEGESKGEEESKLEEEKRPEDKSQLEEKPNLEGESNPEKDSRKELKPEEESKPEEENKLEEKSRPEGESKSEDKPQSEGDVQPPQDQTDKTKSVIKRELDFCKIKDKINKMKDLTAQIREMIQELKLFETERHVRFVKYDNSISELRGMTDEERGMTNTEMYDIMDKVQTLDYTIRCALNMPTEAGYSIRYLEIVKDHSNIVLYHNHAGSIIQKLKQKIDEITESLSSVKGHQSDHSEGSEVIQILQKQITSLKAIPESQDIQRVIQKLDDIINEIKAVENESKAVKDVVTDEAVMVKTLVKQIKDLKKFTDSDNLEFIIQKFKDIITSPFMLKMLLDTLKKFPKSTANRSELYRLFSTIHFEREKDKLLQVEKIPPKFNVIDSFYQYSKDLAVNMFIKKLTSLQAKSNGYKVKGVVEIEKKNQWSRFFDETDLITKLAKRGAQIIEDDGVVRFIHKSILEYFAARQFYDEIVDYNPDNQEEAFDPCLNKGPVVDNETAVYLFIKDIADTDAVKNDKDLTIFDKKLLETLNSPVLQKEYGNEFNKNFMYPNLFLVILMRKNLTKKLVSQKEDSIASVMINNVLKWMFTETSDSTRKFVDMLQKIKILDGEIYVNMNHLLKIYYHHASKQDGSQFNFRFKKNMQQIKIGISSINSNSVRVNLTVKDGAIAQNTDAMQYCWALDAKLFIHDSLDNIVILKSGNKCLAVDTTKDSTISKPGDCFSNYALVEKETPWEVRECKWIMKMNQHEKSSFELNSLTDSTKVLFGSFQNLEEYSAFFTDLCETDIHFGSISDKSYQCRTCKISGGKILCKNCADKCHKGHDIFEYGGSGGYCDCRFLGCCELVVGCTVRFPDAYRNPVMFKCTQCPNDKRKVLCLACKKHHEKEHQNFEQVLDADGCDCDCPSTKTKVIAYAQDRNFAHLLSDKGDNNNRDNEGDEDSDDDH